MFNLGTAVAYLQINARQVVEGARQAVSAINAIPSQMRGASAGMAETYQKNFFALQDVGMAYGAIGVAAAAGLGAATKAAVGWEQSMADVERTTYDVKSSTEANAAALAEIEKGLFALATRKPIPTTDLAKIAAEAGALGISGTQNIIKFTSVIADLAATTDLTQDVAASSLARIGNIMGVTTDEYENMGSAILELGRSTASTEGEIVTMARRIAGAGRVVGLSTDQVLAYAAALASVGVREEQGGSAISRTFIDIQNAVREGETELQIFAAVAGRTSSEFAAAFKDNAGNATRDFIEGLGQIIKTGGDAAAVLEALGITELRQRDALLRLAGAQGQTTSALKTGAEAWRDNEALAEIAARKYETVGAQLQILKNLFFEAGNSIGQGFLPMLAFAIRVVANVVRGFNALPGPVKTLVVALGAFAGVLGSVVGGLVFLVPRAIAAYQALMVFAAGSTIATGAIRTLTLALGVVGALLTIATIAMGFFGASQGDITDDIEDMETAQRKQIDAMEDSIGALDANTGAVEDNSKAVQEAIERADRMNNAQLDLIDAIQSQKAAYLGLEQAIVDVAEAERELLRVGERMAQAEDDVTRARIDQRKANDDLAEAERNLGTARREAAEEVVDAELDLADARERQLDVADKIADIQKRINELHKVATVEELTKATLKLQDARLKLLRTTQKVEDAQWQLNYLMEEGASNRDIYDAQLDLAEAEQDRANAQEDLSDSQKELNQLQSPVRDLEELARLERDLSAARRDAQRATIDYVQAERDLKSAQDALASDQAYREAQREVEEAHLSVRDSARDVEEQIRNVQALQDGGLEREYRQAQLDLEDAYLRVASANVEVQKQMALSRGEIWTSEDQVRAMREELIRLGETAVGPVAEQIRSFGATLNAETRPREVPINVPPVTGVDQAKFDIGSLGDAGENASSRTAHSWGDAVDYLYQIWSDFARWFTETVDNLVRKIPGLSKGLPGKDMPIIGRVIPGAKGGFYTKPTFPMLIGEAGPELLLPLTNMKRTWQLLRDSGLLDQIMSQMGTGGGSGLGSGFELDRFINQTMSGLIGGMRGGGGDVSSTKTYQDTSTFNFISQADPQRIANAMAWKRRVRKR